MGIEICCVSVPCRKLVFTKCDFIDISFVQLSIVRIILIFGVCFRFPFGRGFYNVCCSSYQHAWTFMILDVEINKQNKLVVVSKSNSQKS